MSAELLEKILEQVDTLRPQDLYVLEMHVTKLRRTRPVQVGRTYEVSDFPKGELKRKAIDQIQILEEDSSLLYAKDIYENATLTCLIDDDDKHRALQTLVEMGCLVVETNRW